VMLGTQRVDTLGAEPDQESHGPFTYYWSQGLEARVLARCWQGSISTGHYSQC